VKEDHFFVKKSTCLLSILLDICKLWLPSLTQTTRGWGNGHTLIAWKHVTRCYSGDIHNCIYSSLFTV